MKKMRNHTLHFSLILIMFLISGIAIQIPIEKKGAQSDAAVAIQAVSSVSKRLQSLVYIGNIDSIVDGISRYFVGSMQEALVAFLQMEESPLTDAQKCTVLFGLVHKLRKHEIDQALVCKQLVDVHSKLSCQPVLYAAVKSDYSDVAKNIVRWGTDYKYPQIDSLMFDAFEYAVKQDDLKTIEKLYLHGAYVTKNQASKLLKMVVCENKKIEMAKFFIERTHADPYYVDDNNKSLLAYALYHKNRAFIHAIKNGKKNDQGLIVALS